MKKVIGITAGRKRIGANFSPGIDAVFCPQVLVEIVCKHKCLPVVLPSSISPKDAKEILAHVDGLILSSGEDIAAQFYQEKQRVVYDRNLSGVGKPYIRPEVLCPNAERDKTEIALYQMARQKGIPILGICRGMQLINVAEGGTLHQELKRGGTDHLLESDGWIHYHTIKIDQSTRLGALFGQSEYSISSIHHQGIKRLANNLTAVARAPDGLIEMFEAKDGAIVWGIQGHPEKIRNNYPLYEKMFRSFLRSRGPSL